MLNADKLCTLQIKLNKRTKICVQILHDIKHNGRQRLPQSFLFGRNKLTLHFYLRRKYDRKTQMKLL